MHTRTFLSYQRINKHSTPLHRHFNHLHIIAKSFLQFLLKKNWCFHINFVKRSWA